MKFLRLIASLIIGFNFAVIPVHAEQSSVDNFLPNVNWQLWSGIRFVNKQNAAGTGDQTGASCSSFTTVTGTPVFTCSNTQQIKVGDLIVPSSAVFWGFAGAGYVNCSQIQCGTPAYITSARVAAVVPNVSITLSSPLPGGSSPTTSTPMVLYPIAPGENGAGALVGADGWSKTGTLHATVDDFAASIYPGAIRQLLLRRGASTREDYFFAVPQSQLARFQGQTVTCGVAVKQRIQGSTGTWGIAINDTANGEDSNMGTGVSVGGYEFKSVTHNIGQTSTSINMGITLPAGGAIGDVFDVALPTCYFGTGLVQSQLHQNSHELIRASEHWNPPLLTPWVINMPATEMIPGSGLYGYGGLDLEALSFGTVHNSIVNIYCKIEWKTSTAGAMIFTGTHVGSPEALSFGPQTITIVAGMINVAEGVWPLYHNGTGAVFSNIASLSGIIGTFDFWDVDTAMGNSAN